MALADDDPYVEELLGNASDRAAARAARAASCAPSWRCGALLLAAVGGAGAPGAVRAQPVAARSRSA